MRTVAIELRITSLNKQRSHTQRLVNCILESSTSTYNHLTNGCVTSTTAGLWVCLCSSYNTNTLGLGFKEI